VADVTAAMSAEALLGTDRPFQPHLHAIRPHPGQVASAANLARLMRGSGIVASHRHSAHAVQDSYSVRCSPQVAGAARDTLEFARRTAAIELGSAIDNPVVLENGDVESNGNFHGEPLAFAADFLAIAAAEVGAIAERRVDRLLDPHRSEGLPPFLAEEPGVNSGLMVAQYTAAALVAENRRLAAPASVDSVPTSGMQEDHVSMGWGAALKLRTVLDNLTSILAVELVAAARALDLRAPLEPAPATAAVRDLVRKQIPGVGPDRVVAPELAAAEALIRSGAVIAAAQTAAGTLK
jgi:histidine ammonia-lyase